MKVSAIISPRLDNSGAVRLSSLFESKLFFLSCLVFFRVVLEVGYVGFVAETFYYRGFSLDFSVPKYVESWIIIIALVTVAPAQIRRPSDLIVGLLIVVYIIPLLIFYSYCDQSRAHLYLVILCYTIMDIFRRGRPFKINTVRDGGLLARNIVVLGIFGVTVWMVYSGGLRYFNLDISQVYEFREDVGETINRGAMSYINIWATKVFGPVLLALAIWKRNIPAILVAVGLHIFWFGVSSHKSVLFYPVLVAFICCWLRRTKAFSPLPLFLGLVVLLSYISYLLTADIVASSLFIRRAFFVPPQLTFSYYDFFSSNPHVFWSNSVFSAFTSYPYADSPPILIGRYVGTDSNANNSFLSTGYMHAGLIGVIIYGVLAGCLFKLLDSLANKFIPVWVAAAIVLVPAWALITSSDLPAAILTHGFGVALVILFLLRSRSQSLAPV